MNVLEPRASTRFFRRRPSSSSNSTSTSSTSSDSEQVDTDYDSSRTRPSPGQSRSSLRLTNTYLNCRRSLESEQYDQLSTFLKTLNSLVSSSSSFPTVFIPILERFSKDLESVLTRRQDHQDLGKLNAKALTSLKQKWLKIDNSTTSMNWVKTVRLKVNENPLSNYLQLAETETDSPHTKALLDSIEKLLLPGCTIPKRVCLSNLSITDSQLTNWNLLKNLSKLIEWYTSFNNKNKNKNDLKDKASLILNSIKSLDLSRNELTSFPIWLPLNLFPRLTSLSLSHNRFKVLPPSITLFSGLKRLKTNGNHRLITTSPDKALLRANSKRILQILSSSTSAASASSESRRPSSLFRISIESLLVSTTTTTSSTRLNSLLPPHLGEILTKSYTCQGCQNVIIYSSDRDNKYLEGGGLITERIHFVNPGINLPNPTTTTDIPREEEDSELQVASFEQLLLLMVYNRFDSQPPSSSPSSSRSRKPGLPTLIIGGSDWKFCKDCAKLHSWRRTTR